MADFSAFGADSTFGVDSSLCRVISKATALLQAGKLAFSNGVASTLRRTIALLNPAWTLRRMMLGVLPLLFFASCSQEETYFSFQSLPNSQWDKQQELRFEVPIQDISTPYQISLEIRNNDEYPFRNLCLLVDCQIPDGGLWRSDSVSFKLANKEGKWYGQGISLYSYSTPYCSIQYPDTGIYVYTIRHGMTDEVLHGISDVGLRIEPQNYK